MEWLSVAVAVVGITGAAVARLVWRDRRREPVCPWCGQPDTFGGDANADVCSNCGFDFRTDDY